MRTNEEIQQIITDVLEEQAVMFKLIGTPPETPRYFMMHISHDMKMELFSTQRSRMRWGFDFTPEEIKQFCDSKNCDYGHDIHTEWFKPYRTEYLRTNHPTIDLT